MGRGSSGIRGRTGVEGRDIIRGGQITDAQLNDARPLIDGFDDNRLNTQMRKGVSTIATRYGLDTSDILIGDRSNVFSRLPQAIGVNIRRGNQNLVVINENFYKNTSSIRKLKQRAYASGWSAKTRNPVQHTLVHELAHSKWISSLEGRRTSWTKQVRRLYNQYKEEARSLARKFGRDGYAKRLALGEYALTTIDEFWAEASSQHLLGTPGKKNKYATAIGKIWEREFRKRG